MYNFEIKKYVNRLSAGYYIQLIEYSDNIFIKKNKFIKIDGRRNNKK